MTSSRQILASNKALLATVGMSSLGLLWAYNHRRKQQQQQQQRQLPRRNMSFASAVMAVGAFPPSTNYGDPIINATLLFNDKCPTTEDLVTEVIQPMLQYPRLSQIPSGHSFRQPKSPLDPASLIRRFVIDSNNSDALYQTLTEHLHDSLSDPNSRSADLPWWEVLVVENQGKGPSACVWRVHHALGDGLSLATVAQRVLRNVDGTPLTSVLPPNMMNKKAPKQQQMPWWKNVPRFLTAAVQVLGSSKGPADDPTVFSKDFHNYMVHTRKREIVLLDTMDLDFVKAIKNVAKVSINDVLFACMSQTLHDYLQQENCQVMEQLGPMLQCRGLIPASLPRSGLDHATPESLMHNKWFMLSCDMAVGCSPKDDILERLQVMHEKLTVLKTSPMAGVGLYIQNHILPYLPLSMIQQTAQDLFTRHSVVISNVPGPAKPCRFAKQEASEVQILISNLLPQVSFFSYRDKVFGNFVVDPGAVANAKSLKRLFRQSILALADRLKVPVPDELLKAS